MKEDKKSGYNATTQTDKNIAWFLPRPKPDRYKGGMPLLITYGNMKRLPCKTFQI